MRVFSMAGALALSLTVAACGGPATNAENKLDAAAKGTAETGQQVYSAEGSITAISGDQVTISHGPVEGLGWPAMTMAFRAPSTQMIQGLGVGDRVAFQFREGGGSHVLASISKR